MAFRINKARTYARTAKEITRFYLRFFVGKDFERNVVNFRKKNGEKLRYNYSFDSTDIVFDVGGFKGEFAEELYVVSPCRIMIFEPVQEHYDLLLEKFSRNSDIEVFHFGLDASTQQIEISLSSNSSSYNRDLGKSNLERINLKDIVEFLTEESINEIALMKINIEGAEYDLLDRLIKSGNLHKFKHLQIQFHDFAPDAFSRRAKIVSQILESHECTASFPMVWEFFKLKN